MTSPIPYTEDYYKMCQDGVLAKLRTRSDIFKRPSQVDVDEMTRNRGLDNYFLLRPGAFPRIETGSSPRRGRKEGDYAWDLPGTLYVPFHEFKTAMDAFSAVRWAIIQTLESDPCLSGTRGVWGVAVTSSDSVQFLFERESALRPNYIVQAVTITVNQRVRFRS